METLAADLRLAFRTLWKSPGFTLVAAAALAIGIGANTAIFSVVNAVLLKPLPYPGSERIVRVGRSFKDGGMNLTLSIPKFNAWKRNDAFEAMAAYDMMGPGMNIGNRDRPEQVKAIHVSQEFFRVFGVSPILGRAFTEQEDRPGGPRVAVLSYGLWKSHYGGSLKQLGAPVNLNGEPFTVVGVMPASFVSDPPSDVFLPLQPEPNSVNQGNYLNVAGRLKPGATLEQAKAQMKVLAEQFRRAYPKVLDESESVALISARDATGGEIRPFLLILLGAVGFVLLIACANVANLLLARAAGRQREIAIRGALGASRWRVARQLLTESLVLGSLGGLLGLLLGAAGVRALMALVPPNIPRLTDADGVASAIGVMDWRVLLFTLGAALLTGLLFGTIPAIQVSRAGLAGMLKESGGRSGTGLRQSKLRGALVVGETALALILLIGAALMIRTIVGLKSVNPGFDAHHILTMKSSLAGSRYATTAQVDTLVRQVLQRVEALPGVQAASMTLLLPVEGSIDLPFVIEGRPTKAGEIFHGDEYYSAVTPHYFDTFKIRLLRGRVFSDSDSGKAAGVTIINEAMARKYWPNEDPIGRRIAIGGKVLGPEFDEPAREIVGVVASVRQSDLSIPDQGVMYVPQAQIPDGLTALGNKIIPISWVIRTAVAPLSLSASVQREIQAVDGQMSVSKVATMEQVIGAAISRKNFNMTLLSIFAGIALLLAAIGLYGVMSYVVEQRTQEMGIRMALGAGRGQVVRMVVGQGMALALAGIAIGLGGAYALTRLLEKLLFGVGANDPVTFAAVAFLLAAVAMLATYIPARRATLIDPVIALRYE